MKQYLRLISKTPTASKFKQEVHNLFLGICETMP